MFFSAIEVGSHNAPGGHGSLPAKERDEDRGIDDDHELWLRSAL
jgi:hypothetical protein